MGRVGDATSSKEDADGTIQDTAYRVSAEQDAMNAFVIDLL